MSLEKLVGEIVELPRSQIEGVTFSERMLRYDQRGALVVTYGGVNEQDPSVYSYWSVTRPGEARDVDRFHVHQLQKDRFTVVRGTMWVLLLDMRKGSASYGKLDLVEMYGFDNQLNGNNQVPVYTLEIPAGVYHCIKAPGPEAAELINHPTRPYDPQDEGRVPFSEVQILEIGVFSWDLVADLAAT